MMNGSPPVIRPDIPANCVCKLISVFTRPYTWEVHVWGTKPPFQREKRRYEVLAIHEQAAAQLGMERFSYEIALRGMH